MIVLRRKAIMKRNNTNCVFLFLLTVLMTQLMQLASGQDGEETVLVANFVNGNDAVFDSRVYLFNSSQSAGEVTVRAFTLPLIGDTAQELTATPLSLGTLESKSALNIKVAEDILVLLGIPTPYTGDGGNLTLEFTVGAANVRGAAQVFSSGIAFGTYPLQEIPSASSSSPTVLVANFMNGNDAAFNSRVYLFNPSQSAGEVKVRVFTVPLIGDMPQELTGTPMNLGTLGARSALNIKLAEDILDPLGITTPYTDDGGNLALEFTIEAANVRGAAQVFSSGIAFGTYPLQETVVTESSAGPGPSVVTVEGRQLIVRKRNPDGTLAAISSYIIRGVLWSPSGRDTDTGPEDPNNPNVRRSEFGKWYQTDIPLMVGMNVNTVRLVIDPGTNSALGPLGRTILDELYRNGIMVIMTVDDGVNDMNRVRSAVNFYKDHPAILMWMVGSEWNINRYFGVASSIEDAVRRTEQAAALIKQLDTNHPVATSYGEIDIHADGLRLNDTESYVNSLAPSVDVWGLNIFRDKTFGTLFDQWESITTKPMFLGEFGTDAFRSRPPLVPCPQGAVDEAMQADWDLSLWNELLRNLSASDPSKVAFGGTVLEWNDEWWKIPPAGTQETCGFVPSGHPDGVSNEEFLGIVDIDRHPREVYNALRTGFDPAYQPPL